MKLTALVLASSAASTVGEPVKMAESIMSGIKVTKELSAPYAKRMLQFANPALDDVDISNPACTVENQLDTSQASSEQGINPIMGVSDPDNLGEDNPLAELVGDKLSEFAENNPDGTWCTVGATVNVGGSYLDFLARLAKDKGDDVTSAVNNALNQFIPRLSLPCGSPMDPSPFVLDFTKGMGVDGFACEGTNCKCGSVSVNFGFGFSADILKIANKQLKEEGIDMTITWDLLESQMGQDPCIDNEMAQEIIDMLKDLKKGVDFKAGVTVSGCVNPSLANGQNVLDAGDIDFPVPAEDMDEMAEMGINMNFDIQAATNVVEGSTYSDKADPKEGDQVTISVNGNAVKGTVGKVNSDGSMEISYGDDDTLTVASKAEITTAQDLASAPGAPEVPELALGNSASVTSIAVSSLAAVVAFASAMLV